MQGNESETLLILASLNLDTHPNAYEVRMYLDRYLRESGQLLPDAKISALIWFKIQHVLVKNGGGKSRYAMAKSYNAVLLPSL